MDTHLGCISHLCCHMIGRNDKRASQYTSYQWRCGMSGVPDRLGVFGNLSGVHCACADLQNADFGRSP